MCNAYYQKTMHAMLKTQSLGEHTGGMLIMIVGIARNFLAICEAFCFFLFFFLHDKL